MKKFIIACTAVIIAVICWMFVSDRIGSTLSFNMNKEVKTFTTVSDKEILVDTGNGMEEGKRQELLENMRNADIEMLKYAVLIWEWEFLVILLRIMLLIRKPI